MSLKVLFLINSQLDSHGKTLDLKDFREVLFRREFKKSFPNTSITITTPEKDILKDLWDTDEEYATIPIQELCHITHKRQAKEIRSGDEISYTFKPKQRTGKSGGTGKSEGTVEVISQDLELRTDTLQMSKTSTAKLSKQSTSHQPTENRLTLKHYAAQYSISKLLNIDLYVFPGYLSWWSIDVQHWYKTDEGKRLRTAVCELECDKIYVPHTIQATPTSRYGGHSFSISFEDMVTSYVTSRQHCRSKNVYLLKAGTLVYTFEICYVIMVCMEDDMNEIDELKKLPILQIINSRQDSTVDVTLHLSFRAKHIVSAIYPTKQNERKRKECYNYEEMAFAFYFKGEYENLCCEKSKVKYSNDIEHKPKYCVKPYCPDNPL